MPDSSSETWRKRFSLLEASLLSALQPQLSPLFLRNTMVYRLPPLRAACQGPCFARTLQDCSDQGGRKQDLHFPHLDITSLLMHPETTAACLAAMAVILEVVLSLWAQEASAWASYPTFASCPLPQASAKCQLVGTTHQAVAIHRVTVAGMAIAVAARAGTQVGPARHPGKVGIAALAG